VNKKYSKQLEDADRANKFTDWMYSEIKPFLAGSILEVGSGIGTYSKKIAKDFTCNQKVFSDFDHEYVGILKNKFEQNETVSVIHLDLTKPENSSIKENSFDSIFALNVLEHIEDDISAIENIYEFLRPNGTFVMLVPAHKFLYNCMDEAAGHHRRYSKKIVLEKIKKTNFKLKKLYYFNFLSIFGWYINGSLSKKSVANENALGLFNKIVPLAKFLEKYILNKKMGISVIAVMEKPGLK